MESRGVCSLLFWALLGLSAAQDIQAYFKIGGQLELDPKYNEPITNILWKLNGDLVAEWIQKINLLEYYGRFLNRTTLDTKRGLLTMTGMKEADLGTFSLELNHKVQPQRYITNAIEDVPEPSVIPQPAVCHSESHTNCALRCGGDLVGVGPVTYSWKEGDGQWQEGLQVKNIAKAGTKHIKEYSCKIENPIGEKSSGPKANPFYDPETVPPPSESSNVGVAVGVTVGLLIALAVGGLVYKFRDKIRQFLPSNRSEDINGHKPSSPGEASASPPESVPLNSSPVQSADSPRPTESA